MVRDGCQTRLDDESPRNGDLLTFPWVGSTASIRHFWAAAFAAGRSLTCPLPAQRVHRGSRVKGGRRPSQRDALAPLTREGCTRRRRGPDLHARMGTQSRCSEIDPRKRHKSQKMPLLPDWVCGASALDGTPSDGGAAPAGGGFPELTKAPAGPPSGWFGRARRRRHSGSSPVASADWQQIDRLRHHEL